MILRNELVYDPAEINPWYLEDEKQERKNQKALKKIRETAEEYNIPEGHDFFKSYLKIKHLTNNPHDLIPREYIGFVDYLRGLFKAKNRYRLEKLDEAKTISLEEKRILTRMRRADSFRKTRIAKAKKK